MNDKLYCDFCHAIEGMLRDKILSNGGIKPSFLLSFNTEELKKFTEKILVRDYPLLTIQDMGYYIGGRIGMPYEDIVKIFG